MNIETLKKLAETFSPERLITGAEVDQILMGILGMLKDFKSGTESLNADTRKVVNSLLEEVVKYNQKAKEELDKQTEDFATKKDERMQEVQTLLEDVKVILADAEAMLSEVKDGKDADEEKIIESVVDRIKIDPTVVTVSAQEVRDKLSSLKDEERLDKSAIKGLDKILTQKDIDYAVATLQQQTSFLINKGGLKTVSHDTTLTGDGTPENPLAVAGGGSGITLQTDGVANGSQTLLNLVGGTNVTLTDNGTGSVTITASGGSGSGDVVGPASSTDNAVVRFDGITGKLVQNSGVTISDTNVLTTAGTIDSSLTASELLATNGSKQLVSLAVATYPSPTELTYVKGVTSSIQTQINAKGDALTTNPLSQFASTTSAQLAGVISDETGSGNLVFGTSPSLTTPDINDATADSLQAGTTSGGVSIKNNAGTTVASFGVGSSSSTNISLGGNVALNSNSITMTGSLAATGARVTKGWFTDIESTNIPTVGGTAILTSLTAPQFTTIELGNASDTTLSRSSAGVLAVEGVVIPSVSSTNTLSNKTLRNTVEPGTDDTYTGEDITGFNATATIAQWEAVYLSTTGWALTDADSASTAGGVMVGLAAAAGTSSNPLTVVTRGVIRNDGWTWTTVGAPLYLSTTAGALTETAPSGTDDVVRIVGYVMSDDCIFFNPSNDWITRV